VGVPKRFFFPALESLSDGLRVIGMCNNQPVYVYIKES